MDPLFEFLWGALLVLIVVVATWPLVPLGIGLLLALGLAILGAFSGIGILLAVITVWVSRHLLLRLLPDRLDLGWIWSLFLFWFSLALFVAPPLWIGLGQYSTHWDHPWSLLHLLSTLSYLVTSYRLLVKWQPREPQWLQFIAVWSAYQLQHRMVEVETTLEEQLSRATRQHFEHLGKRVPRELQLREGGSNASVAPLRLNSGATSPFDWNAEG